MENNYPENINSRDDGYSDSIDCIPPLHNNDVTELCFFNKWDITQTLNEQITLPVNTSNISHDIL